MLLSRVPTLEDVLLLRLPDPSILRRPRPEALRVAYANFHTLQLRTLEVIDATLLALRRQHLRRSVTLPLLQR